MVSAEQEESENAVTVLSESDIEGLSICEELAGIMNKYPRITEFEFEALSPYVMQFYIESYQAGNQMETEKDPSGRRTKTDDEEMIKYLSPRFILIGYKLGVGTQFVIEILKETTAIIKEFREHYKAYQYKITTTFSL